MFRSLLAIFFLALGLTGCGSMRLVETEVKAVTAQPAGQPIAAGSRYRFERLPSQANELRTGQVEAIAEAALGQAGLVRDDTAARYSVQINARMQSYLVDAWGHPIGSSGTFGEVMIGTGSMGGMFGLGMGMTFPPPTQYRHEVSLLLRELSSGQLVYETRATHDGPWRDSDNILRALFVAALKNFPNPPAGTRRVKVEIPR